VGAPFASPQRSVRLLTIVTYVITIIAIMPILIQQNASATTITAMDLRRQPGRLLDRVYYRNESFLVERAGKPKAVLVPLREYREIQRRKTEARKLLFQVIDEIRAANVNKDPKEIEDNVATAIQEVRQQRSAS
jgi:prevent-host-death family protein